MRLLATTALSVFILVCSGAENVTATESIATEKEALSGENLWAIDQAGSSITFTATQAGAKFKGRFNRFDLQVRLNPEDLSNAEVRALIDISSVDANDHNRNETIPGKIWFDTNNFPTAAFHSTDVRHTEADSYEAHGTLTIKGVSQPHILPFNLYIDGNDARAVARTKLDRTDFNIGSGEYATEEWVGFDVSVKVNVAATRD